jgi:hypothetical protein
MSEKYYACAGKDGCGKLFIGTHPAVCPECGNAHFVQGIENIGFRAKKELAAIERAKNNAQVKRNYRLQPKKRN